MESHQKGELRLPKAYGRTPRATGTTGPRYLAVVSTAGLVDSATANQYNLESHK